MSQQTAQLELSGNITADLATYRRRSPNIWDDCPWDQIASGQIGGTCKREDFNSGGLITSPTTEAALVGIPYIGFGSAGTTITHDSAAGGGLVLTQATDNLAAYFKDKFGVYQITKYGGPFWAEWRIKVSAITANQIGFIAGFMDDVAMTVTVPLSTANPPILATTMNFVGFRSGEEDSGLVRSLYQANAVTTVDVQTSVYQFVADTYVKMGLKYKPKTKRLYYYINGIELGTSVAVPDATGTDFPADVRMNFMFGERLGASTSSLTTCDWFQVAQVDA